jgi:hypothetical protein
MADGVRRYAIVFGSCFLMQQSGSPIIHFAEYEIIDVYIEKLAKSILLCISHTMSLK